MYKQYSGDIGVAIFLLVLGIVAESYGFDDVEEVEEGG